MMVRKYWSLYSHSRVFFHFSFDQMRWQSSLSTLLIFSIKGSFSTHSKCLVSLVIWQECLFTKWLDICAGNPLLFQGLRYSFAACHFLLSFSICHVLAHGYFSIAWTFRWAVTRVILPDRPLVTQGLFSFALPGLKARYFIFP